jgi:hypothetical protein
MRKRSLVLALLAMLSVGAVMPATASGGDYTVTAADATGTWNCRIHVYEVAHPVNAIRANVYWGADLQCDRGLFYAQVRPTLRWADNTLREESSPESVTCVTQVGATPGCGVARMATGGFCYCAAPNIYKNRTEVSLHLAEGYDGRQIDPWVLWPPQCVPNSYGSGQVPLLVTGLYCTFDEPVYAQPTQ